MKWKSRDANRSLNSIVSMRPADGKHVEWIDDEAVVLDPSTEELHYLNGPAALVYALILEKLNQYFDRSRGARAPEAPFTTGEILVTVVPLVLGGLFCTLIILSIFITAAN